MTPCLISLLGALLAVPVALAESPRRTPTVELAAGAGSSVVAIYSQEEGAINSGSGTVIHPGGYILTNDHVVRNRSGQVLFHDGSVRPYRVVGRCPEKDIAVILVPAAQPLKPLPLGRSHDIMTGEPVVVAGNPGGRGIVFSSGIVSSPRVMVDAPIALIMQKFPDDTRDRFIQFDAASNPGNSGGPLINAEGSLIGVVCSGNKVEENINFAIPIDRVRDWFARMMAPEAKGSFSIGIDCDPFSERALVARVIDSSPASKAGLKPGDILTRSGDVTLRHGLDWTLSLVGGRAGANLPIAWERDGLPMNAQLKADAFPTAAGVDKMGTQAGLHYAVYALDNPVRLPDFTKLKPVKDGITQDITPRILEPKLRSFGLLLKGLVDIQEDDWCRLILESDDGSRLHLDNQVIIENDGPHPPQEAGAVIRVGKGLHPLRLEFFELSGDSVLRLFIEKPNGKRTAVEKSALFHRP